MRPYVIGGACHRVQTQLDIAMQEGVLELPAELAAHVERCPHCGGQAREVEALFERLRSLPAGINIGPVPGIVDKVLEMTAIEPVPESKVRALPTVQAHAEPQAVPEGGQAGAEPVQERKGRPKQWQWVLGQVAAVVAVLAVAVTGLTLLINQAVGGVRPGEVVQKWVAPLHDWTQALFENTQ